MGWVLVLVMLIALVGLAPGWPYSRSWGYGPVGLATILFFVLLLLLAAGIVPWSYSTMPPM